MRKRGGAIVEKFEHPTTKRIGVIRLDKSTMLFWTEVESGDGTMELHESKSGSEVRAWLREQLERTTDEMKIAWEPVVEIKLDREDRWGRDGEVLRAEIDLRVDRYYLGLTPNQQEWRRLDWNEADPDSSTKIEAGLMYARSDRYGSGPKAPRRDGSFNYNIKPFALPSFDSDRSILRYTPELWKGLQEIVATTKRARTAIEKMVRSQKGVASIVEIGQGKAPLLLGSGE